MKTDQKWRERRLTFTARAHSTFPLAYHSKNDLRLVIMFIFETRNWNPHDENTICGKAQKPKTTFGMQRLLYVKLYIMYWLDFKDMNKSTKSNLLYDFEF